MKQLWKNIKKPLWRLIYLIVPLFGFGWCFGLYIFFYYFEHSYAQSAVWAIWSVFCLIVYKIKQYEL